MASARAGSETGATRSSPVIDPPASSLSRGQATVSAPRPPAAIGRRGPPPPPWYVAALSAYVSIDDATPDVRFTILIVTENAPPPCAVSRYSARAARPALTSPLVN